MNLNVVLFEPEIPANTGNIMRTCMVGNVNLHLIEPLGFYLDEKSLKRAGLDYMKEFPYKLYNDWLDFENKNPGNYFFITRYGKKTPLQFNWLENKSENIYLIFGKESSGLPYELLHKNLNSCIRLPMIKDARSLNLANTVAIMVYHVLGEFDYPGLAKEETIKGEDWIYQEK